MEVVEYLNIAGRLRSSGRPFARPVLMAASAEEDEERKALLLMAYRFYYANDHTRGDVCVELAGYEDTEVYTATAPLNVALETAKACLQAIVPSAPVTPPGVEAPTEFTSLPTTVTGLPKSWKVAYSIARAGSVLHAHGMPHFGDFFIEMAKKVVSGNAEGVPEMCPELAKIVSVSMSRRLTKERVIQALEDSADILREDEEELYKTVKEVQKAVKEAEWRDITDFQALLQHLADTIEREPIDHPRHSDYLYERWKRVPDTPTTDTRAAPTDPDKVYSWVEDLAKTKGMRESPLPCGGFYAAEYAGACSSADLVHWVAGKFRMHNVPAACVVRYTDKDGLMLGVRWWAENESHVVWLYPTIDVEEPPDTTAKAMDPTHRETIIEAPELPF